MFPKLFMAVFKCLSYSVREQLKDSVCVCVQPSSKATPPAPPTSPSLSFSELEPEPLDCPAPPPAAAAEEEEAVRRGSWSGLVFWRLAADARDSSSYTYKRVCVHWVLIHSLV